MRPILGGHGQVCRCCRFMVERIAAIRTFRQFGSALVDFLVFVSRSGHQSGFVKDACCFYGGKLASPLSFGMMALMEGT